MRDKCRDKVLIGCKIGSFEEVIIRISYKSICFLPAFCIESDRFDLKDLAFRSNRSKFKISKHGMTSILIARSPDDGETLG